MSTTTECSTQPATAALPPDTPVLDRAPSRAGYRRPPLARSFSSRNLFPDLPPISTQPKLRPPSADSDSSSSSDEDEDDKPPTLSVLLPSLCGPPSPVSPVSPASSSSSGELLPSPTSSDEDITDYQDQPGCDGFPPPPLPQSTYIPPPPQQPTTPLSDLNDDPPTLFHHGISRSAFAMYRDFWDRRYHLWQTWREHVDHLDSIQAQYARDGLRATLRYPASPALPRSRALPQASEASSPDAHNAASVPSVRLQTYNPYAPIFPRLGDIPALRDPYCDWYDRAYINFPTYSIHKILFLHDMLHRARPVLQLEGPPLPDSPASIYSTDDVQPRDHTEPSPPLSPTSHSDVSRPWEVDWRVRWQVLVNRQPHAPQHYPPPSAHGREYEHSPPPPSPEDPVYGWSAPSPMSPVFSAPPPPPVHDEHERFVWQESDDVPELIPLEGPLTRAEFELGAPSVAGARVGTCEVDALHGAGAEMAPPVVKLPTSLSSSDDLPMASPAQSFPCTSDPVSSPDTGSAPSSFAAAFAAAAAASAGSDTDSESDSEETAAVRFRQGLVPPRPASPAPMFFFYDDEDEETAAREMQPVSVSVQPVSC
ncbi:hypothetical protein ACG7TL_005933 [Trametes sanguinea]